MDCNWEKTSLADVSEKIDYGFTASATDKNTGTKFLRITDIQNGFVQWNDVPFCEIDSSSKSKYLLKDGDIVVARTGNSTGENYLFQGESFAVFASYLIRFRVNKQIVDPSYVWRCMRSSSWRNFVRGSKTGSAQAGANAMVLGRFEFEYPPLHEQKAIAEIFRTLDEKIELNQKNNECLEEIAKALFKSWFIDFLPVRAKSEGLSTGLPEDISNLFPDSFEDSELGGKPRGWRICHLDQLLDLKKNLISPNENPQELFDHYSIPAFDDRMKPTKDIGLTIDSNKFLLTENVFLVSKLNPDCPRVWLPSKTKTRRCIASTEFMVCQPKKEVGIPFAYCLIKSYKITQQMISMVTGTSSSHQRLRPEDFRSITSVRPNDQLFEIFSNAVSPILEKLLLIREENNLLTEYQNVLLPKLISGQIKIPDAEKMLDEVGI